jgi:guanosine-3',5'-bis(diphosphate) 3'-pyrophosphohydrolase
MRVALTVLHVFGMDDPVALCAALLHDTIEDTTTDYDDLFATFGKEVADAVAALTKDMRLPEPEREAAYDLQLAAATWQARLVKLADVYDNFCDSVDDAKRAKAAAKAERAIACAGDDPRLRAAVSAVAEMIRGGE